MRNLTQHEREELHRQAVALQRQPYSITIEADECAGKLCYVARHPELPGCMAQGQTPQEAVAQLQGATELYLFGLLKHGANVPPPHVAARVLELASVA